MQCCSITSSPGRYPLPLCQGHDTVTGQAPQTAHTYPLDDVLGWHAHHNPQRQLILLGASADSIHGGHIWGWSSEAVLARAEPPGLAMLSQRQILPWLTVALAARQIPCSLQVSSTLPAHSSLSQPFSICQQLYHPYLHPLGWG